MEIIGTRGNDFLSFNKSEFTIAKGRGGNDTLIAEHGAGAILFGGRGRDTLDGGPGYDVLDGGRGRDKFLFNDDITSRNVDAITDFKAGRDKIVLDLSIFCDVRDPDWFGTVVKQDGHVLTYNGKAFAILRGEKVVDEGDFLFV